MGKGSNTTTTTNNTTSAPDPYAGGVYRDILSRAQGVANTPYQAYTGELTAPVNAQQNLGVAGINANAGYASPFISQAAGLATNASNPLTAGQIAQYQSPYTQQVVDATQAQFNRNNAQQQAALRGNQISSNALGGNRAGIAAANLSSQQATQQNPIIAGLYDKSYQSGLATANQQFQQNPLAAGNAIANYGISGQGAALSGAGAQLGAGTLQQQTEQQRLNAAYGQYQQAQAFPYQQAQWLAGIGTGVGSQLGGTSSGTGTSTAPPPNQTAQWLGLGLSAAGMLSDRDAKEDIERVGKMNDGTPIYRFRYKGQDQWHIGPMAQDVEKRNPDAVSRGVDGYRYVDMHEASEDSVRRAAGGGVGGVPWEDAQGWIPKVSGITSGSGAPRGGGSAPSGGGQQQPAFDPMKLAQSLQGAGRGVANYFSSPTDYGQTSNIDVGGYSMPQFGNTVGVGSYQMPTIGFARGGGVAGPFHGEPWERIPGADISDGGWNFLDAEADVQDPSMPQAMFGEGVAGPSPGPALSFADRAAPVQQALATGDFDMQGGNATATGFDAPAVPLPKPRPDVPGASVMAAAEDPDEMLPPSAAPTSGRGRGAGVAAFAPEGQPDAYGDLPDAIRRPEERAGFGVLPISKNVGTGLLAAGLGMMASRSPNLGNAIGEGGLTGVAAYRGSEANDQKLAAEAAKLAREARKDAQRFGLDERRQTEAERHNKESEKNTRATADRTKFVPAGQYMGADGVYRPVAMDSSTGKLVDMGTGEAISSSAKVLGKGEKPDGFSDDDASKIAERYVKSGDRTILQGFGTSGAAKIKIQRQIDKVMEKEGITPEAMAQRTIEFEGRKSGSRTLGTMEAKMGAAAFEAEGAIKLIRGVIEKLPRTAFLPFNQLIEGYSKRTLNPDQAELYARAQAIVNTYSAVMSRGANVTTDSSRHHASQLLNTAYDPTTFNRVLDTMQNEIDMAKASPAKMQEYYAKHYGPKSIEHGTGSAGGPPRVVAPSGPQEGRTGTKNGRPVIVKGGKVIYQDTGESAQ